MVSAKIVKYIEDKLKKDISEAKIIANLKKAGIPTKSINAALTKVKKTKVKSKKTNKVPKSEIEKAERIRREYFRGEYFIYTPESDFNSLDIVDILFHLEELYRKGLDGLDRMIESTFEHLKKIKFKNKQLHDYTGKKKRFKIF